MRFSFIICVVFLFALVANGKANSCADCGDGQFQVTVTGGGVLADQTSLTFTFTPSGGDPIVIKSETGDGQSPVELTPLSETFNLDEGQSVDLDISGASTALFGNPPSGSRPNEVAGSTGFGFSLQFGICAGAYLIDSSEDPIWSYDVSQDGIITLKLRLEHGARDQEGESSQGVEDGGAGSAQLNGSDYEHIGNHNVDLNISLGNDANGNSNGTILYRKSLDYLLNPPLDGDPPVPVDPLVAADVRLVDENGNQALPSNFSRDGTKVSVSKNGDTLTIDLKDLSDVVYRSYSVTRDFGKGLGNK